jgi:protein-L-isoaspartate(D-aspartate) O-methyltransferase
VSRPEWVDRQLRRRGIDDPRVLAAMGRVPRERFVPERLRAHAYDDAALQIGYRQTISQPYVVARICEALELSGDESVLDVGTGSGYQAAVLAELARSVLSIERVPALAERARLALAAAGYENVEILVGDGSVVRRDRGRCRGAEAAAQSARAARSSRAARPPGRQFAAAATGGDRAHRRRVHDSPPGRRSLRAAPRRRRCP